MTWFAMYVDPRWYFLYAKEIFVVPEGVRGGFMRKSNMGLKNVFELSRRPLERHPDVK
jgi:hypothetical protein